jgi:hypothetical protein
MLNWYRSIGQLRLEERTAVADGGDDVMVMMLWG